MEEVLREILAELKKMNSKLDALDNIESKVGWIEANTSNIETLLENMGLNEDDDE